VIILGAVLAEVGLVVVAVGATNDRLGDLGVRHCPY
jgi:hypothetical protein